MRCQRALFIKSAIALSEQNDPQLQRQLEIKSSLGPAGERSQKIPQERGFFSSSIRLLRLSKCCKKNQHLCFRLASRAELLLTSPSHPPETFPSKEPQQTPNCFCCFQSHQNILPSLQMSTIPACATATGEGGRLGEVFFFRPLITQSGTWRTLFSRLHFSISGPRQPVGSHRESLEPGLHHSLDSPSAAWQ